MMERAIDAIKNGELAVLEELLDSPRGEALLSAKITIDNPTNHAIGKDATLLQLASYRTWQGEDTTPLLMSRGADVDLHSACGLGMTDKIDELLTANPDGVNSQVDTYFPLQYAITAKRVESIERLMHFGDDPNRDLKKVAYFGWEDEAVSQEYTSWKPIHHASLYGFDASRVPIARCLQKHGADLNAVSPLDGYRPIHLVAMPNRVDMIRFFVECGVDVDSRSVECDVIRLGSEEEGPCGDAFEMTPLMVACGEGFLEATECLLQLGADANARNDRGQTALHLASRRFWDGQPYDQVIKALLAHGADSNARDNDGNVAK